METLPRLLQERKIVETHRKDIGTSDVFEYKSKNKDFIFKIIQADARLLNVYLPGETLEEKMTYLRKLYRALKKTFGE